MNVITHTSSRNEFPLHCSDTRDNMRQRPGAACSGAYKWSFRFQLCCPRMSFCHLEAARRSLLHPVTSLYVCTGQIDPFRSKMSSGLIQNTRWRQWKCNVGSAHTHTCANTSALVGWRISHVAQPCYPGHIVKPCPKRKQRQIIWSHSVCIWPRFRYFNQSLYSGNLECMSIRTSAAPQSRADSLMLSILRPSFLVFQSPGCSPVLVSCRGGTHPHGRCTTHTPWLMGFEAVCVCW